MGLCRPRPGRAREGGQDRRGMARAAHAGAVPRRPPEGDRAALHRQALLPPAQGAPTGAPRAATSCSARTPSSTPDAAGRASRRPSRRGTSTRRRTPATAWCAPRWCATAAARTWATCSTTGRSRPACATASTRSRSASWARMGKRSRASHCPRRGGHPPSRRD